MSLHLTDATQAEILRAVQKDNSYVEMLQENVSNVISHAAGNRIWLQYSKLIQLATRFGYYTLTTLSGSQTLGEEYTGIVQVDSRYIAVPHKMILWTNVLLECAGEFFILEILKILRSKIENNKEIVPRSKKSLLYLLAFMEEAVPFIQRLHKGLFLINGGHYQISKKITTINYVLARYWMKNNSPFYAFQVVGMISLLHLFVNTIMKITTFMQSKSANELLASENKTTKKSVLGHKSSSKCVLCLENRINTSTTSCGHLFCWDCILDWLTTKLECPLCREPILPRKILLLQNYV